VETGDNSTTRSIAHIVSNEDGFALAVYVRREDRQMVALTHAQTSGQSLPFQGLTHAENVIGGIITLSDDAMSTGAKDGAELSVCDPQKCYPIRVPATLFQQALLE